VFAMRLIPPPAWADETQVAVSAEIDGQAAYRRFQELRVKLLTTVQDAVQGYVNDPTFTNEYEECPDGVQFPAQDVMTGEYYIIRETYKGEAEVNYPSHALARIQTVALQRRDSVEHPGHDYLGLAISIILDLDSGAMKVTRIDSAVWF
jgi:hypothetical protein